MYCSLEIIDCLTDNPMGTSELVKKLGYHHNTVLRRLHELHAKKRIEGRKIRPCKAGEWIWWKKKETNNVQAGNHA